jgi:FkbM family methyltransferase
MIKSMVKALLARMGFNVVRNEASPHKTLLGLAQLPFRTIIDVGANTGQFARTISEFFPTARIYCFEPLPQPYQILQDWAKTQSGRVVAFNFALGSEDGMSEMLVHLDHSPSSSLLATTPLAEQVYPFTKNKQHLMVQVHALDEIWNSLGPKPADVLIKLDVQGFEDRVIRGGRQAIMQANACIVEIGLQQLYEYQASLSDVTSLLKDLGYYYGGNLQQTYGVDGRVLYIDAVFTRAPK